MGSPPCKVALTSPVELIELLPFLKLIPIENIIAKIPTKIKILLKGRLIRTRRRLLKTTMIKPRKTYEF